MTSNDSNDSNNSNNSNNNNDITSRQRLNDTLDTWEKDCIISSPHKEEIQKLLLEYDERCKNHECMTLGSHIRANIRFVAQLLHIMRLIDSDLFTDIFIALEQVKKPDKIKIMHRIIITALKTYHDENIATLTRLGICFVPKYDWNDIFVP